MLNPLNRYFRFRATFYSRCQCISAFCIICFVAVKHSNQIIAPYLIIVLLYSLGYYISNIVRYQYTSLVDVLSVAFIIIN